MSLLRKVGILLIILCTLTGIVSFAETSQPSEGEVAVNQKILDKLTAFGFWNDRDLTETVTRAEFTAIIAELLSMGENRSVKDPELFNDVTKEYEYYNQIETMYDLGIISSSDIGEFRPEDNITYAEAVKILVVALGYGAYADINGGYPNGYLITAMDNRIVPKSFGMSTDIKLNFSDVSIILDYALKAKIMERQNYGDKWEYRISDATILTKYHNIDIFKGVIQSVGSITIDEDILDSLNDNNVKINERIFEAGNTEPKNMLGYNVNAYYRKDNYNHWDTLIYIEDIDNDILDLDDEDIEDCEQRVLFYWGNPNNRVSRVNLPESIKVLKNDSISVFNDQDFKNADRIILIDNNRDGLYEIARLEIMDIYVVSDVSYDEYIIYDKYVAEPSDPDDPDSEPRQRSFKLKPEDSDKDFNMVDDTGNPVDVLAVKPWTVVAVPAGDSHQRAKVIVTNRKFTAIIDEVEIKDQDSAIITIDGDQYRTSKNLTDNELKNLQVNEQYNFYLDHNARIAGFEITVQSGISYGFLVKAGSMSGVDSRVQFQVFAEIVEINQPFRTYTSAKRMELDGMTGVNGAEAFAKMKINNDPRAMHPDPNWPIIDPSDPRSGNGNVVYFQMPIKYRLNEEGELVYLDTPYRGANEDEGSNSELGNSTLTKYNDFYRYDAETNKYIGGGTYFQDLKYFRNSNAPLYIASATKVILAPKDPDQFDDVKAYGWTNNKYFESFTGYPRNNSSERNSRIEAYDVSKSRIADLIVYYTEAGAGEIIVAGTPLAVVDKITHSVNEEGEVIRLLYCFRNSSETVVPIENGLELCDSQTQIGTIERGDIIRYGLNKKGELNRIEKVFDLDDEDDPIKMNEGRYSEIEDEFGNHEITQDKSFVAYSTDRYSLNNNYFPKAYMQSDSFTSGYRVTFAKLLDKTGDNMVYRAYDLDPSKNSIEISTLPLHNTLCIDEERDEIYRPDINEFIAESENENDASWMIVHTSGGKVRQLILIKRKK